MNQNEFENFASVVFKEYRAVCYTNGRHWIGDWKSSYHEAFEEADRHRYGDGGTNRFHDVRIIERVSLEASVI